MAHRESEGRTTLGEMDNKNGTTQRRETVAGKKFNTITFSTYPPRVQFFPSLVSDRPAKSVPDSTYVFHLWRFLFETVWKGPVVIVF